MFYSRLDGSPKHFIHLVQLQLNCQISESIIKVLQSKSLPNPGQTANGGIINRPDTSTNISKNRSLANAWLINSCDWVKCGTDHPFCGWSVIFRGRLTHLDAPHHYRLFVATAAQRGRFYFSSKGKKKVWHH